MPVPAPSSCTAFLGQSRIASGSLVDVTLAAKAAVDRGEQAPLLIFDNATSEHIEIDFRGTANDVLTRLAKRFSQTPAAGTAEAPAPVRKAGRPKLGVVGREVTLLPRHWDWLAEQPGGASVALRKLIDAERKSKSFNDLERRIHASTYRFMQAVAGNLPQFEEALRALFAGDRDGFALRTEKWPVDVRDHARWLMAGGGVGDDANSTDEEGHRVR